MELTKIRDRVLSQRLIHYLILFGFSYWILLFFTKSSPLFYLNDWVDVNAFFTVGKGMVHGLVPYRDLFEQKGPFLYLIYAFAYLFSNQTLFGGYLLEGTALGISLVFFYKTARFYLSPAPALCGSFFVPIFLLHQPYFQPGGSAEEFATPLLFSLIWLIFRIDQDREVSDWAFFGQGIAMGCVFWMKYTMVGAWMGFFLVIFFAMLFQKNFRKLAYIIIKAFAGFACATVPWLVYFGIHGALGELYQVYFHFNMKIYPADGTIHSKFFQSIDLAANAFRETPLLLLFLFGSLFLFLFSKKFLHRITCKWLFLSSFVTTGITTFWGAVTYPYYPLILVPFCSIGIIAILSRIPAIHEPGGSAPTSRISHTILCSCFGFFLLFAVNDTFQSSKIFPKNSSVSVGSDNLDTTRPAQLVFANLILARENATLLNYGALDHGVFTVTGLLPSNRFFERQNISYNRFPDNMDEQNEIIRQKAADFVIYRSDGQMELEEYHATEEFQIDVLLMNYEVIAKHRQEFESIDRTYWLLARKE